MAGHGSVPYQVIPTRFLPKAWRHRDRRISLTRRLLLLCGPVEWTALSP
ncbi:hypothetical protein ppKF707_0927 [Metapseudomonas furukawaii]|uniref:Uncharacterized protein n=1 Tax=Metapseudomonas furukawaii TaxID=1149133 RepID=A0AAD1FHG7_METFU|nr:hypothetical protein ppKF707_0927 [Pseudomonas furukawaii]BAU75403.1 hypothetical protein KF707C_37150 [Pseudomonas furukawaii]